MKIVFKKDEDSQITVFHVVNGEEKEFLYVDMIKALIDSKKMEEPDIEGSFTEAEIKSINSMVECINKSIIATEEADKEPKEELNGADSI